jgi:transcriptional regulator with XRE-family HTH domain
MTTTELVLLMEARDAARSGRARRLRTATGLSQAEVAAVIGVSSFAVSRWESGDRRPRGAPAIAYARLLRDLARQLAGPDTATAPGNDDAPAGSRRVATTSADLGDGHARR